MIIVGRGEAMTSEVYGDTPTFYITCQPFLDDEVW